MTCTHYWDVGEVVRGKAVSVCRRCHATKQFQDYIPTTFRNYPEKQDAYVQRLQMKRPAATAMFYEST